jgi:uncharacterized repeat protein (TIGR02543 family)
VKKVLIVFSFVLLGLLLVSCSDSKLIASNDGPYTVDFNSMGGSEVTSVTVDEHEIFLPPSIPTKEGFIFAGWYLDANYYYPMAFNAGTAGNLTLYAKWVTEQTLNVNDLRSIILTVLTEQGYDVTATELLEDLEDMISENVLKEADIRLLIAEVLTENGLALTREELTLLISETLLEGDFGFVTEDVISTLVDELLASSDIIDENALITTILENLNVVQAFEDHITNMLKEVSQSVVMIDTYDGSTLVSGGSGVIYKRSGNNYYVLTNEHVVYDYDNNNYYSNNEFSITIFRPTGNKVMPRSSTNITLLGKSITHDLAILRFTTADDLRVIEMGTLSSLKVGQLVFAIGSPLDLPNTSSMGIISQYNRPQSDDSGFNSTTIQHTATINPGNSGGALVNIHGQLIGINNMSYVDMEVGEGIEGLHFAIQINILLQMIPNLENA